MSRVPVLRPIGAIVGLLCCALAGMPLAAEPDVAPATADDADGVEAEVAVTSQRRDVNLFKILKLDGHQVRWSLPADGSPRVITYRLVSETLRFPAARNCRGLAPLDDIAAASGNTVATLKEEARAAFTMWETAANIVFKEAPDGAPADILIGAQTEPEGWAFADVFYDTASPARIKPISQALVCLNPAKRWKVGFDGDLQIYDLRYTLAHEIGHAIGLDHPPSGSQIMHFKYEEHFRALQAGDIKGAALLYGTPTSGSSSTLVAGGQPHAEELPDLRGKAVGRALGK